MLVSLVLNLLSIVVIVICKENDPVLNWGTYRPGYYYGLRARHPRSPLFGFMWYDGGRFEGIQQSRHACQDSDRLSTYGWHRHNAKDFGQQVIFDPMTNLHLTTSFIKFKYENTNEDAWLSVIDGRNIPNGPNIASGIICTVWYVISGDHANDTATNEVLSVHDQSVFEDKKKYAHGDVVQIDGTMFPSLFEENANSDDNNFDFSITQIMDDENEYGSAIRPTKKGKLKETKMDKRTYITGFHMSEEHKWKAKSIYNQLMEQQVKKLYRSTRKIIEKNYPEENQQTQIYSQFSPNLKHAIFRGKDGSMAPNIFLAQNYLKPPFRIYYVYLPTKDVTINSLNDLPSNINTREKIEQEIVAKMKKFDAKFEKTFGVITRPKPKDDDDEKDKEKEKETHDPVTGRKYLLPGEMQLARYALSNLVGGIGYWYGNQIWQMHPKSPATYTPDMTLLSAVPSRSFFPRGFLWDEGFHELMIGIWDYELSVQIIESWLDSMNDDGWIPREQILGDEARSRVPEQFQIQQPHIANPPTMFLAINALVERYYHSSDEELYKILCSDDDDEVVEAEIATDGTVTDVCQKKVDDTRRKIKTFLERNWDKLTRHFNWYIITQTSPNNENSFRWAGRQKNHNLPSGLDDYPRYVNVTKLEGHVDMHCWMITLYKIMSHFASYLDKNEEANEWKQRRDVLQKSLDEYHWNSEVNAYQDYVMIKPNRTDVADDDDELEKVFVNHIGYVSSFPLFLEVIDASSPNLIHILKQLSDEEGMWSKYGLRSLSKSDELYGKDEDYWRGAIWMNMNYLAVKALNDYKKIYQENNLDNAEVKELLDKLYKELRENLINNLYREYAKFGFLYENYNGDNGNGQRSKPFTGWSALIVNIITEMYP